MKELPLRETDLIVLVADKDMEFAVEGVLSRPKSISLGSFTHEMFVHPAHDPGCAQRSHDFLRQFHKDYDHALVIFDHDGSGQHERDPDELQNEIEANLASNGWGDRAACVVIEPELENWVWSESPHVAKHLGWTDTSQSLRDYLESIGRWEEGAAKPSQPKEAMQHVLKKARIPWSSSIHASLASTVSLQKCSDSGFLRLLGILERWFGVGADEA